MIGFHASHEQFSPKTLLHLAMAAEEAGFQALLSSDHFHPWSQAQGQSGFAWSWLGAALQATALPCGVVCAPGQRYHPAVIAQAAATLAEMFPDRFWIAVGSGQLLNEGVVGERWPSKAERNQRLQESAMIMRALWAGETVTRHGLARVEEARLYVRPERPPLLVAAAVTAQTARWAGSWADGLITISRPRQELRRVVDAFREGGGEGKPMFLKAQVSYAPSEEEALHGAWEQWRTNVFENAMLTELRLPAQFEAAAAFVGPEDMRRHVRVSSDASRHADWLLQDLEMGFALVAVHNVNREQRRFIDFYGERVLPRLRSMG